MSVNAARNGSDSAETTETARSPAIPVEFNVEERWPELFAELDDAGRDAVLQALASNWLEGWVPNREDVENLTDLARGAIDKQEYDRRAARAARRGELLGFSGLSSGTQ